MLILIPLFDISLSVLPPRFGEVKWRYGSVGLLANAMMVPMAGLLIAFLVANTLEHRKTLRTLGVLAWVGVLGAVLLAVSFGLDALQTNREVNPQQHLAFVLATATGISKLLFATVILGLLGTAGLKKLPPPRGTTDRVPLIGESRVAERPRARASQPG